MKLENQVCSLKLAKKLKKLGVKQESLWCWVNLGIAKGDKEYPNEKWVIKLECVDKRECYSAPTVAELGEMLPSHLNINNLKYRLNSYKNKDGGFAIFYTNPSGQKDKSEANARAKMLIYLIENKLIHQGE